MNYFDWEDQPVDTCPPVPADSCDVNYCPVVPCVWTEVEEGVRSIVTLRGAEDIECTGELKNEALFKYPAIKVSKETSTRWYNGSATYPIYLAFQEVDKIIFPLIQDERGQVRHYRPAPIPGTFKIISKNQSIRAVPDALPAIASAEGVESVVTPEFYLGANLTRLTCSEGQSTIQLLKVYGAGSLPFPVLPITPF